MYQMLGLYEDCLVQYDELDALFTQFVLNYAAGGEPLSQCSHSPALSSYSLPVIITPVARADKTCARFSCYIAVYT